MLNRHACTFLCVLVFVFVGTMFAGYVLCFTSVCVLMRNLACATSQFILSTFAAIRTLSDRCTIPNSFVVARSSAPLRGLGRRVKASDASTSLRSTLAPSLSIQSLISVRSNIVAWLCTNASFRNHFSVCSTRICMSRTFTFRTTVFITPCRKPRSAFVSLHLMSPLNISPCTHSTQKHTHVSVFESKGEKEAWWDTTRTDPETRTYTDHERRTMCDGDRDKGQECKRESVSDKNFVSKTCQWHVFAEVFVSKTCQWHVFAEVLTNKEFLTLGFNNWLYLSSCCVFTWALCFRLSLCLCLLFLSEGRLRGEVTEQRSRSFLWLFSYRSLLVIFRSVLLFSKVYQEIPDPRSKDG